MDHVERPVHRIPHDGRKAQEPLRQKPAIFPRMPRWDQFETEALLLAYLLAARGEGILASRVVETRLCGAHKIGVN